MSFASEEVAGRFTEPSWSVSSGAFLAAEPHHPRRKNFPGVRRYRTIWFDYPALDREVITAARTKRTLLPKLWDEPTDRSARSIRVPVHERAVIVIAGPMLLGRGLEFDVSVRLDMSEAAMRRHTPEADLWTVDALLEHRSEVSEEVDFEVRYDHPARPAVRSRP